MCFIYRLIVLMVSVSLFVYPSCLFANENSDRGKILTIDYAVPHVSSAAGNTGENVVIFLRERVKAEKDNRMNTAKNVVLFVHGGSVSVVPAFDFSFKDYSWAEFLAGKGFDVFLMDLTGYGFSPRPQMTDPCNVSPTNQQKLTPNPIPEGGVPCDPSFYFVNNTIESERDEINSVIEFIKDLRDVQRVNLIGWSGGGIRTGTYTSINQDNVEKLIILASSNYERYGSSDPPAVLPRPGYPMSLQDYDGLIYGRWFANVHCDDQVEQGSKEAAWAQIMPFDPLGSSWGTPAWNPIASPDGGIMRVVSRTNWGWNAEAASRITIPTLIMVGEFDGLLATNKQLFEDLGSQNKVFIKMDCACHFVKWERQHVVLQEASLDWLLHSSVQGVKMGEMWASADGKIHRDTE